MILVYVIDSTTDEVKKWVLDEYKKHSFLLGCSPFITHSLSYYLEIFLFHYVLVSRPELIQYSDFCSIGVFEKFLHVIVIGYTKS